MKNFFGGSLTSYENTQETRIRITKKHEVEDTEKKNIYKESFATIKLRTLDQRIIPIKVRVQKRLHYSFKPFDSR